MRVSNLPRLFLRILDEIAEPEGFKRKKTTYTYKKWVTKELSHNFHLNFISHPGIDYDISVDVGVTHLEVEKLRTGYREGMTLAKIKEGSTYGEKIKEGIHSVRWTIDFDTDLKEVAQSIWETVKEKGPPFWEKYSDVRTILNELYLPNPKDWKCDYVTRARLIPVIHAVLGEKEQCVEAFKRLYKETKEKVPKNFGGIVEKDYLELMRYVCSQIGMKSPY